MKQKSIYLITSVYLTIFTFTVLLLKPFWFDINKFLTWAIGFPFFWVEIIFALTMALIAVNILFFRQKSTILKQVISLVILIIWVAVTFLLFSELGDERDMIKYQFFKYVPYWSAFLLMVVILGVLPLFSFWKNSKVRLLSIVLITAFFLLVGGSFSSIRFIGKPYLQAPGENAMTIMWVTSENSLSWVEYGENFGRKAYAEIDGSKVSNNKVHKITLTGLKPGTEYQYRVVSKRIRQFYPYNVDYGKEISSSPYRFTTLDREKESFSFLILNDLHEHGEILPDIMKSSGADIDFVVLNGDYFNDLNHEHQLINKFVKPLSESFASEIPFILTRGNHETRGVLAGELEKYTAFPDGKYYFPLSHGLADFLFLDSGEDKEDGHIEYSGLAAFENYRSAETIWLENTLQGNFSGNDRFKVVFSHIPLNQYTVDDAPHLNYQRDWVRLLNQYNFDILYSGHTHEMENVEASEEIRFPIAIGGGVYGENKDYVVVKVSINSDGIRTEFKTHRGETISEYFQEQ